MGNKQAKKQAKYGQQPAKGKTNNLQSQVTMQFDEGRTNKFLQERSSEPVNNNVSHSEPPRQPAGMLAGSQLRNKSSNKLMNVLHTQIEEARLKKRDIGYKKRCHIVQSLDFSSFYVHAANLAKMNNILVSASCLSHNQPLLEERLENIECSPKKEDAQKYLEKLKNRTTAEFDVLYNKIEFAYQTPSGTALPKSYQQQEDLVIVDNNNDNDRSTGELNIINEIQGQSYLDPKHSLSQYQSKVMGYGRLNKNGNNSAIQSQIRYQSIIDEIPEKLSQGQRKQEYYEDQMEKERMKQGDVHQIQMQSKLPQQQQSQLFGRALMSQLENDQQLQSSHKTLMLQSSQLQPLPIYSSGQQQSQIQQQQQSLKDKVQEYIQQQEQPLCQQQQIVKSIYKVTPFNKNDAGNNLNNNNNNSGRLESYYQKNSNNNDNNNIKDYLVKISHINQYNSDRKYLNAVPEENIQNSLIDEKNQDYSSQKRITMGMTTANGIDGQVDQNSINNVSSKRINYDEDDNNNNKGANYSTPIGNNRNDNTPQYSHRSRLESNYNEDEKIISQNSQKQQQPYITPRNGMTQQQQQQQQQQQFFPSVKLSQVIQLNNKNDQRIQSTISNQLTYSQSRSLSSQLSDHRKIIAQQSQYNNKPNGTTAAAGGVIVDGVLTDNSTNSIRILNAMKGTVNDEPKKKSMIIQLNGKNGKSNGSKSNNINNSQYSDNISKGSQPATATRQNQEEQDQRSINNEQQQQQHGSYFPFKNNYQTDVQYRNTNDNNNINNQHLINSTQPNLKNVLQYVPDSYNIDSSQYLQELEAKHLATAAQQYQQFKQPSNGLISSSLSSSPSLLVQGSPNSINQLLKERHIDQLLKMQQNKKKEQQDQIPSVYGQFKQLNDYHSQVGQQEYNQQQLNQQNKSQLTDQRSRSNSNSNTKVVSFKSQVGMSKVSQILAEPPQPKGGYDQQHGNNQDYDDIIIHSTLPQQQSQRNNSRLMSNENRMNTSSSQLSPAYRNLNQNGSYQNNNDNSNQRNTTPPPKSKQGISFKDKLYQKYPPSQQTFNNQQDVAASQQQYGNQQVSSARVTKQS